MNVCILRELLFGDDKFFCVKASSQLSEWDFRPRMLSLTQLDPIKEADPNEEIFKVFIFKDHIEVWPIREWLTSISFQLSLKGTAEEQFKKQIKEHTLEVSLQRRLGAVDPSTVTQLAAAVRNRAIPQQIIQLFKLDDIIRHYHGTTH